MGFWLTIWTRHFHAESRSLTTTPTALAQTQPIKGGKLLSTLDANQQDILAVDQLTFGGGSPTSRIHIRPGATPTTASDGIRLGDDVVLYRSTTGTLALTGNLVVSGSITGTGAPLSLSGNNTWTGTNAFQGAVSFASGVSIPDGGLSFTGPGVTATRTALGLVPGTDIQPYDADLTTISGLLKTDGAMMVGDGANWVLESGATLRTSLGLGTGSSVVFSDLTTSGAVEAGSATITGQLALPGATASPGALLLGTTTELYEDPAGTIRTPDNLRVNGTTWLGTNGTHDTQVTGQLWLGTGTDAGFERTGAGQITVTGDLVLGGGFEIPGTIEPHEGGTGQDYSALAADRYLYTTGVGTFGTGTITAAGRGLIDDADTSTMLTTLGAQPSDADLTTLAGLAKTKGNLIGANGTAWTTLGVGTDGQVVLADSTQALGFRWGDVITSAAPIGAKYLTQTTDGTLTNEQALSTLSSGIMRVANGTGVVTSLTTSNGIAANLSDETGTGALVFGTTPTITTPIISGAMTMNSAINYPDGVRQTFNPDATTPGLNVGSQAGDPSGPSNGDLWYDSTANELTARINGASVALGQQRDPGVGPFPVAGATGQALTMVDGEEGQVGHLLIRDQQRSNHA